MGEIQHGDEAIASENLVVINNAQGQTRNTIIMQTASLEEKISPNAELILEKKFQDCKHTVSSEAELPPEMVNLTKAELAEQYPDWTVKEFSKDRVVLYRLANRALQ